MKKAILNFIGQKLMAAASVVKVKAPSPHFRLISLQSKSFEKWTPGDKIQINTGDWNMRTYTPLNFNRATQTIEILAFIHGDSPGARWAATVSEGFKTNVLGPRSSFDFTQQATPVIFFGDETTFGAAKALHATVDGEARFVFEVRDVKESEAILKTLDIGKFELVEKTEKANGIAAEKLRDAFKHLVKANFVFAGNAQSIKGVRAQLSDIPNNVKKTKAYWAEGKVGLD